MSATEPDTRQPDGPLKGLRVIDAAVLFAGPVIGTLLARLRRGRHQGRASPRATRCGRSAGRRTGSRSGGRSSTATSGSCPSTSASPRARSCSRSSCKRRRRAHRVVPARHVRALGPRAGRAPRHQPAAGHGALLGLRPDRALQPAPGLRHGRRVDQRLRPHQRPAGRPADAAAVRAGRRRGLACSGPSGRCSRCGTGTCTGAPGPGHRPRHLRAAVLAARSPVAGLRPAGLHPEPDRQQHRLDRAPQRVPDARRPVAGAVGELPVDRRAGHAPRRATRRSSTSRGSATTTAGSSNQDAARSATSAAGSRAHDSTRCWRRSRRSRRSSGPSTTIADIFEDPQYHARDTITTVDDPQARPGSRPERDPAPDARRPAASATWAATWGRTTTRSSSMSWAGARTSSSGSARRVSSAGPRSWATRARRAEPAPGGSAIANLKDVARRAEVDPSTASRVLRGDPAQQVRPETRQRILDAARDLRYRPNALARSLRTRRTGTIGLVIPSLDNVGFADVTHGIQQAAAAGRPARARRRGGCARRRTAQAVADERL